MNAKQKRLLVLGVLGLTGMILALTGVLLVPWKHNIAPAIRIQVLDETGNPPTNVRVEQEWEYHAIGSEPKHEVSQTDGDGYVSFPARSVKISMARQILTFLRSLRPHGHEFGPFASIEAHGPDPRAWDIVICGINDQPPRPLRFEALGLGNSVNAFYVDCKHNTCLQRIRHEQALILSCLRPCFLQHEMRHRYDTAYSS
ncbi:MAG TPA: hypothetical protein VE135_22160 [Pyrinomonadaceae bacterium]|nr:hypothetical protein [Pyrinomonadaceae bacterium]